jgi:hypothetical protein
LFTVGELARRLDVSPGDVLEDVLEAGATKFSHEGELFTPDGLQSYLGQRHFFSPVPELEFELSSNQIQWLAAMADVDPALLLEAAEAVVAAPAVRMPRKFVGSQTELSEQTASRKVSRLG